MKKFKVLAAVMALVLMFAACESKPKDAVAKVGKGYITKDDLQKEYDAYRKLMYSQMTNEELNKADAQGRTPKMNLLQSLTQGLVMDKIISDELKANKLEISQEEMNAKKQKVFEQSGGEEAFNKSMQEAGVTTDDFFKIVEKQLRQNKLRDWYIESHKKSDEEVQKYFDEHKDELVKYDVSHILVKTEDEAKEIKKQLDGGAKFEDLAKEKSTDKGSGEKGGALGEVTLKTNFVKEFLDAMKELKTGEISAPVKSQFGYHIIKANAVKDNVKDLNEEIQSALLATEFQQYLSGLYQKTDVTVYTIPEIKDTEEKKTEEPQNTENKPEEKKDEKSNEENSKDEKPEEKKNEKSGN